MNMNKPELTRKLSLIGIVLANKIKDFPKSFTAQIQQDIASKIRKYLT